MQWVYCNSSLLRRTKSRPYRGFRSAFGLQFRSLHSCPSKSMSRDVSKIEIHSQGSCLVIHPLKPIPSLGRRDIFETPMIEYIPRGSTFAISVLENGRQ